MSMVAALPFTAAEMRGPISEHWQQVRDGDPRAVDLYRRHYSCDHPDRKLWGGNYARFAGQGRPLVLLSVDARALFVWRKERYRLDGEEGVNCAVFRNEGGVLSSLLIREAMALAWHWWPGERLFTFVNPRAVGGDGKCFKAAGWVKLRRRTKKRRLVILEAHP